MKSEPCRYIRCLWPGGRRGVSDSGSYVDSAHPAKCFLSSRSYARAICEDPVRRGLLYVGTENAIYVSFDDGENWQPLQNNLPHAPVSGITVQEHFNDLVISTYGRGLRIPADRRGTVPRHGRSFSRRSPYAAPRPGRALPLSAGAPDQAGWNDDTPVSPPVHDWLLSDGPPAGAGGLSRGAERCATRD